MRFRFGGKKRYGAVSLSSVLPEIFHEFDLEKSFTMESLKSIWPYIVGDIISTHSMPERISRGILYISVDHSVFANEISLLQDIILKKIRDIPFSDEVKKIRAEVKRLRWGK